MRQEVLLSSLQGRLSQGSNWLLVALVGGMFSLFRLAMRHPGPGWGELLFPFALLLAHLAFSPLPWQWTGDDAPKAPLGRGVLQALLFNVVWVGMLLVALHWLGRPGPPPGEPGGLPRPPFQPRPLDAGLLVGLLNVGFALIFGWVFAEKEASEAKASAMAEGLRLARSRALQNQLKPHVLYNALNSLSELVYEDPLAAEEVIARLADLYRMLAVHGDTDRVPLGQERRLVEAYLAMEQMRLGDRLSVRWEWPPALNAALLPPLLLQPLVENAIKHGISPRDVGGELRITGTFEGEFLTLKVENTGHALSPTWEKGIGLRNLEARLSLWPEAKGVFTLESREGWTVAGLHWMVREAA
jgi:hypothetical protein